jgi:hypothetical protein
LPRFYRFAGVIASTVIDKVLISDLSNSAKKIRRGARAGSYLCLRALATVVVMAALLAPHFSGLLLFQLGLGCSCKMSCCKTGRSSCCRRSSQSNHPAGASWANSPGCPEGCRQSVGLPSTPNTTVAVSRFEVGPRFISEFVSLHANPKRPSAATEFALFERPPPIFCVSS